MYKYVSVEALVAEWEPNKNKKLERHCQNCYNCKVQGFDRPHMPACICVANPDFHHKPLFVLIRRYRPIGWIRAGYCEDFEYSDNGVSND